MEMSRAERFRIRNELTERLGSAVWDYRAVGLLFHDFGHPFEEGVFNGPTVAELVASLADTDLAEMRSIVFDVPGEEITSSEASTLAFELDDLWEPGMVRVFLSHCSEHKEFVSKVADEMATFGVHGFVAHADMESKKDWQPQLEHALRTADAFVAFLHPGFGESEWCDQELGWALGRCIPVLALRFGVSPKGLIGKTQCPSGANLSEKEVANLICDDLLSEPSLEPTLTEGLLSALCDARTYDKAGEVARRIRTLGQLTDENWTYLDAAYQANAQVSGSRRATAQLEPLYRDNGRGWPPPFVELDTLREALGRH